MAISSVWNTGATAGFIATWSGGKMRVRSSELQPAADAPARTMPKTRARDPSAGRENPELDAQTGPDLSIFGLSRKLGFGVDACRSRFRANTGLLALEHEREGRVRGFVGDRKLQTVEGAQHAAFD